MRPLHRRGNALAGPGDKVNTDRAWGWQRPAHPEGKPGLRGDLEECIHVGIGRAHRRDEVREAAHDRRDNGPEDFLLDRHGRASAPTTNTRRRMAP